MVLLGLIEGGYVRWVDTNSNYLVKKVLKWAFMAFTTVCKNLSSAQLSCNGRRVISIFWHQGIQISKMSKITTYIATIHMAIGAPYS